MPKTAEQRKREFDDAKDKRPKVLTHNGVVVPEIKYVRQSAYETRLSDSQAHHGGKGGVYIGFTWFAEYLNKRLKRATSTS